MVGFPFHVLQCQNKKTLLEKHGSFLKVFLSGERYSSEEDSTDFPIDKISCDFLT